MNDKKTTINILGEEITIAFNVQVEIAYEEISGEAFSIDSLAKMKNSVALYMAAIITANPNTDITVERLMKEASGKEIAALSNATIQAMSEWMDIPKVIPTEDKEPEDDGEKKEGEEKN